MLPVRKLFMILFYGSLLLSSCEEKPDPQPNTLEASAGADQQAQVGQTVTLTASASGQTGGESLTYLWNFIKKPAGSQATLTGANAATATFVPDLAGEYELEVTVSTSAGAKKDRVLVTTGATALVLDHITVRTVLEDRIADPTLPDYLANKDIAVSAELTVKPGVVIAFAEDAVLEINDGGVLIAKGLAENKVRFTGEMARKGYWGGIVFYSNSSANEFLETEIEYAGSRQLTSDIKTSLLIHDQARVTIKNTSITQSGGYGLYLADGSTLISFANNAFSQNTEAPVRLMAGHVAKLDAATAFTGSNGRDRVEVMRSALEGNGEIVWPAFTDNTPYRFVGLVTAQTGWKLSPGITVEVAANEYIEIGDGYLNAVGTPEKKITFTGVNKTAGYWNGIIFYSRHASNRLENVELSYAGGEELTASVKSGIALASAASLQIKNSSITHSGGYGIHVFGTEPSLNADAETSNTFVSNALKPVFYNR